MTFIHAHGLTELIIIMANFNLLPIQNDLEEEDGPATINGAEMHRLMLEMFGDNHRWC